VSLWGRWGRILWDQKEISFPWTQLQVFLCDSSLYFVVHKYSKFLKFNYNICLQIETNKANFNGSFMVLNFIPYHQLCWHGKEERRGSVKLVHPSLARIALSKQCRHAPADCARICARVQDVGPWDLFFFSIFFIYSIIFLYCYCLRVWVS
jgi:hypothetical protein